MTLADEVRAFMRPDNPGFKSSRDETIALGPGLSVRRDAVGLACARYFHTLGPETETPDGAIAYAFVAGVMHGVAT